ncbi:MAG: cytochrome c oxidase subunit II [Acidobacteriaceae bacterium]
MKSSSVFSPHSSFAWSIYHLNVFVLIAMGVILLLVSGLVLYASWRFRAIGGEGTPKPNFGNLRLELMYTILPAMLLAAIMVFTVRTMQSSDPPQGAHPDDVEVVGHQWWWEFRYPQAGFVTANEVHIPVDTPMLFGLGAADVIHDFWVPELGRKEDMIPGTHGRIWLAADRANTYSGACAEFCGVEHAWMRIRVIAQSKQEYASWLHQQQQTPALPASGEAAAGLNLFQQLSCANCHTIRGTGTSGTIGPDLTHLASRETLAAGRLNNTPDQLYLWLQQPDIYKPGSHMPNLHLTDMQLHSIVAYLETLR